MPDPREDAKNSSSSEVWDELFGIVRSLAETVDLSVQVLSPPEASDKVRATHTHAGIFVYLQQGVLKSEGCVWPLCGRGLVQCTLLPRPSNVE